ncbi:MAG: VCBS repeat-containing protein [Opitutus sp.]|nr:VCBS repeat-containing protein [Opitutus sp.]
MKREVRFGIRGAGWALMAKLTFGVVALAAAPNVSMEPLAKPTAKSGATMFREMSPEETGIVAANNYDDPRMWDQRYQELVYGAIGTGVAIADYDGDGRPDVFVVSKVGKSRLFRNLGGWKFEDVTDKAGVAPSSAGWSGRARSWLGLGESSEPGEWTQGATFADVNNDGRPDLYICRFAAPNLLYINQGDGTFREEGAARGLDVVDSSGMAAFADYDRDGWLDVFVQTNLLDASKQPNGRVDRLFRNRGDGTFVEVTATAGIAGESAGHSATWWDYDGDGWPDLYVANDFATPDRLYRNNGDGTFTDVIHRVVPHMPYYAMGADLGDVNNDGLIDFFVADMPATTREKDQRGMAVSRARAQLPPSDPAEAPQYMRNMLYVNTGLGRLQEASYLAGVSASDWTWSARFEDLDNDGRLDLHLTNGMIREYHNVDLLDRLMGTESPTESRRLVRNSPVLAEANLAFRNRGELDFENVSAAWGLDQVGVSFGTTLADLDGDGDLDLVVSNLDRDPAVFRNDSTSGYRAIVKLRGTRSNRDGIGAKIKIETASGLQVRELSLARGYLSSSEPVAHFGLGSDDRIRRLTIEWPSGVRQTLEDLPANHRFVITEPSDAPTPATPRAATRFEQTASRSGSPLAVEPVRASADFDRSGAQSVFIAGAVETDAFALDPRAGASRLVRMQGENEHDITDAIAPALRTLGRVNAALWVDLDRDGWLDLIVAESWGAVRYFHNREGRALEDWTERAGFAAAGNGIWLSLAAGDFNGDGRPDLAVGNLGLNTRYRASREEPALVYLGQFGSSTPITVEARWDGGKIYPWETRPELAARVKSVLRRFPKNDAYSRATLAEILGANRLAAARRFEAAELSSGVFLSQPDGTWSFQAFPRLAQLAPIVQLAVADFDGDGALDLVAGQNLFSTPAPVGRFGGGLGQLLLNDGRGGFVAEPTSRSGLIVPGEVAQIAVNKGEITFVQRDGQVITFRNRGK